MYFEIFKFSKIFKFSGQQKIDRHNSRSSQSVVWSPSLSPPTNIFHDGIDRYQTLDVTKAALSISHLGLISLEGVWRGLVKRGLGQTIKNEHVVYLAVRLHINRVGTFLCMPMMVVVISGWTDFKLNHHKVLLSKCNDG